jgi:hypothetical protein
MGRRRYPEGLVTLTLHPRSPAARVLAFTLLVAGWVIPLAFPHLGEDDLLCEVSEGAGGEAGQVSASGVAVAADHCAVCHLQRSFRSADVAGNRQAVALASARLRLTAVSQDPHQPARLRLPARAPPA